MGEATITIDVLDGPAISTGNGDRLGTLPRGRAELVFAYLALERRRVVRREELADALWPDVLPGTWAPALRGVVSDVRRFLDDAGLDASDVLAGAGGGYQLCLPGDVTVDVDAAREALSDARAHHAEGDAAAAAAAAARAAALTELPFLPQHEGDWVEQVRGDLEELHSSALELAARAHVQAGDPLAARASAERLVRLEPYREPAHQLLIEVLIQAGDRAAARKAYDHCRTVLRTELGVELSADTEAAMQAVLATAPAAPVAAIARPVPAAPTAPRPVTATMLERDGDLGVLDDVVRGTMAGAAALALIEGPAGIGKSRLLAAMLERAHATGMRVLTARGTELERELPFGAVRQLFEPLLAAPADRAHWLSGSAVAAARVFGPTAEADGGAESFDVLHGLYWLTANLAAEAPLLVAIEDLHWCDTASLRFVAHLEPRLEGMRTLVACTLRTGEVHPQARLLDELSAAPATVPIRPRTLSAAAAAQLVEERLGAAPEPSFVASCVRATGGNPLLLQELLKTLRSEGVPPDDAHADVIRDIGPRAVSRTVLLRLARLPADAAAVARAVAVLGDGAELPATAALCELDEARVAEATRVLIDAEILRAEPTLDFVHPLVRDVVYRELAPPERALRHERAARLLQDLGAAPERVAAHLLLMPARGQQWVATLLREAGLAAGRRGDAAGSVAYLRRALAEPPAATERPRLLMELAWAEGTEDTHAAIAHAGEAYELLDDPLRRTIAATIQARMLLFTRTAQEAAAVVQRAQRELPAGLDDLRFGLEAFELYTPSFGASVPDADARLAQVRERGALDGVGGRLLGAVAAWNWALTGGRAAECGDMAIEALSDGSLIRVDPRLGAPVAVAVLALAERDEVVAMGEAVLREGQRRGEPLTIGTANLWRGFAWLERGELAEAESVLRQAREMIGSLEENGAGLAYVAGLLARVLHEGGDAAGARSVLAAATPAARGSDGEALLRRSAIELRLESGAWEQALAEVDQYRGDLRGADNPAWAPWRSLKAQALDGLGRRDEAMALVEEELVHARHWGAPGTLARTLRLLGTLRDDQGLDLLHEAVACAARSPARLEHAKALVDLGTALRRADRRDAAREPLREGFELASHCEARALAAHARTELYAAGGRPRREALTEPGSLTPSERRIAELAAAGSRNRDIAQVLYVTPKTVEVHLTSIYRKLGISARAQLADALG